MLAQLDGPADHDYAIGKKHGGGLKKLVQNIEKDVKKVAKKVVHIGAAPSRIAFLGLVRLNLFHLATHLDTAWVHHNAELKKFWTELGGDPNELLKYINLGDKAHLSGHAHHAKHAAHKAARHAKHAAHKAARHAKHADHKAARHAKHHPDGVAPPDGGSGGDGGSAEASADSGSGPTSQDDLDNNPSPDDTGVDDGGSDDTGADDGGGDNSGSGDDATDQDAINGGPSRGVNTVWHRVDAYKRDGEQVFSHERRVKGEETTIGEELYMSGIDHNDLWNEMVHPHTNIKHKSPIAQAFNHAIVTDMHSQGHKLGQEPASTTAAVAATPILVAIVSLLKKLGIGNKEDLNKIEAASEAGAEALGENPRDFPVNQQMVSVLPGGKYQTAGFVPGAPIGPIGFGVPPLIIVGGLLAVGALILNDK